MTDDLVKRARLAQFDTGANLYGDLSDRIEELIAERDEAWKRAAHAEKMWGETEVKLAKAVEALKCWNRMMQNDAYDLGEMVSEFDVIARTTLAELTGGNYD